MRTLTATLLFTCTALAQDVSRVYHFTSIQGPSAFQDVANTVRSLVDIRDVTFDAAAATLSTSGTPEQMAVVDWLFPQLDQSAGRAASSPAYQMSGDAGVVQVFRLSHLSSPREIQELINIVRTTAGIPRAFGANPSASIVVRGSADQVRLTAWLVSQLDLAGPNPTAGTQATQLPGARDSEVRVVHLVHTTSPMGLQELVNTIRTIADMNRVFPCNSSAAIVLRGEQQYVTVAEWLIGQLDLVSDQQGPAPHQQDVAARDATVARVFYLQQARSAQQLQTLVNTLRATTKMQRLFPCLQASAVSARGSADQIAQAEKLIADLDR